MAIQLIPIKCPACNAALTIEENRKTAFCTYCGAKILIQNDHEYIYRHIDEASIKRSEAEREIRMRELDLTEKDDARWSGLRIALTIVWLIASLTILTVCIIKMSGKLDDSFGGGFLMLLYLGAPVIGGGGYLIFKILPEAEREKKALRAGGIRFPKGLEPFDEKNYDTVQASLKSAGFTNVQCVSLHDTRLRFWKKGKIDSISVNGKIVTNGGKHYSPDASIVITYHGV